MWFAGGRSLMYSSLVVLLIIISLFHIWVCPDCTVGAIRIYPPSPPNAKETQPMKAYKSQADLYQKYFHGRASDLNSSSSNTTQSGFQDSKRRVPSCPDPLHNK